MENPSHDSSFAEHAQFVWPQALGEPGQRRFRIVVVANGLTWMLWMEKQQVQALGLAFEQMFEVLPVRGSWPDWVLNSADYDEETDLQFRVGRLEMGFDSGEGVVVIAAHDIQQDDMEAAPNLRFRMTMDMARAFSDEAAELMSKGRPLCPMCGLPRDAEHVCPEQNGHLPLDLDDPFLDLG